ncbi:GNAT family N-acetyltransferase [Roseibium sp. M-1]
MSVRSRSNITFTRLADIAPELLVSHMSDPRVGEHMPLLTVTWDWDMAQGFIAAKEACWQRDGLGHWAFLDEGRYVGWGGFQKEDEEWDFGLVLTPDAFGLGARITRQALDFAAADERIPFVTFLLPPSRRNLGALKRLGAAFVTEVDYAGSRFLKYRLETPGPRDV